MIPVFPNFKKIEATDKYDVEKFTSESFSNYSDFNFTNLLIWDVCGEMAISQLNNNLVVIFNDYLSGEHFLSFVGKNKISETASELIKFSEKKYNVSSLKLIPEEISNVLGESNFTIAPDINSHDYIYSVSQMVDMDKWPKNSLSKKIRQSLKRNLNYTVKLCSIQEILPGEYQNILKKKEGNKSCRFGSREHKAFERLLQIKDKNIKIISLYIEKVLIGFTVYEILPSGYALSHFAKADTDIYPCAYNILNWEEAKVLKEQGVKYCNWEQDLGIQGLRNSKLKYNPCFLLKKNIVSKSINL
jgi:uncharacterized protein